MGMTDILLPIGVVTVAVVVFLLVRFEYAYGYLYKKLSAMDDLIRETRRGLNETIYLRNDEMRRDIGKSLSDLNNLLNEYNMTLDNLMQKVDGYEEAVNRIEASTFDFKKLVASYAAEVYDFGQDMRKQMDSLGNSQMKILESMASVFHKIPPTTAKDIFEGGKSNDNSEQGEAEGYSDEAGSSSDNP